jgi:hypothetical protein
MWLLIAALLTGADVTQFLGRTITDVRVEISGVPVTDPGLLELIETRVAEPLGMRNVRGTIDHLVGLGRFEDVRARAGLIIRSGRDAAVAAHSRQAHHQDFDYRQAGAVGIGNPI